MRHEPLLIELSATVTGWLKLPERAGTVRGEITAAEVREGGEVWLRLCIPMWQRWSTQVQVGRPSKEGMAPGTMDVWAPAGVVESDEDNRDSLRELVRGRLREHRGF